MKDLISLPRIELLHPSIREQIPVIITHAEVMLPANYKVRVVQGLRTIDEQNALYAQGRTAPGKIVTNAKGGSSYHNYGLAIDFAFLIDGAISWTVDKYWMVVVQAFIAEGYVWGGNFKSIKDNPHFEKTGGYNWRDLLKKYNAGNFIAGTKYVTL